MNFDRMNQLIGQLEDEAAALKREAKENGFTQCCVTLEFNPILKNEPHIRVYLSPEGTRDGAALNAPTVEGAYDEVARRLNWQRDIDMKLITND